MHQSLQIMIIKITVTTQKMTVKTIIIKGTKMITTKVKMMAKITTKKIKTITTKIITKVQKMMILKNQINLTKMITTKAVSYTHLTLPTKA